MTLSLPSQIFLSSLLFYKIITNLTYRGIAMRFDLKTSAGELHVLRYDIVSGRPTIVFLHDSLGCIELWRDFPNKLGQLTKCNVLVYDRQGYGQSGPFTTSKRNNDYLEREADVLLEVLEVGKIETAILFGHSDGGSIALIFAAKYPSKVAGIITEGAHIFVEDETLDGIRQAVKAYQTTNLKAGLEKYHGNKTGDVFWSWAGTWLSDEFRTWNIEGHLPLITCPVLIIQGEEDEYGTLKQLEGIANKIAGVSTQLILPDVTHTPHKEAPETVLQKSVEFVFTLPDKKQNSSQQTYLP
jgi:pimeloyl-ACP methyl ester carboxylesterase